MAITKIDFGSKDSKTSKEELQQQLAQLKPALQEKYEKLESKGFVESWDYKNEEGYEMTLIDIALNPSYSTCEHSSRYADNDTTIEYCEGKAQLYELDKPSIDDIGGSWLHIIVSSLMILMPCLAFGAMCIFTSKRREINAFLVQQQMPVAQEGIEKIAPTIGKAGASIAKEMAPVYGEVAKEISKGIK